MRPNVENLVIPTIGTVVVQYVYLCFILLKMASSGKDTSKSFSAEAGPSWRNKVPLTQTELERLINDSESELELDSESDDSVAEDFMEYSEHDTDSCQEDEYEDDASPTPLPTDADYYIGKDKNTKWRKVPPSKTKTRKYNIITHLPGYKGPARTISTPSEDFYLFFDDYVMQLLVTNTNNFITAEVKDKFTRERDARLVTESEIKAFLAILVVSGVMRSSHLNFEDLFDVDDMGNDFFIPL